MWIVLGCFGFINCDPGLRKIPKIYNAVVTTDQNLAPSRAYPVIQPVVHRTAIGYVPPFYYSPINPSYEPTYTTYGGYGNPFPGPESPPQPRAVQTQFVTDNPNAEKIDIQQQDASSLSPSSSEEEKVSNEQNPSTSNDNTDNNNKESINDDVKVECKDKPNNIEEKKTKKEQIPLNFYPNYRSTYYDPYYYGYNPYQQMPTVFTSPGNYYVDYHQQRNTIYPEQMAIEQQPFLDDAPLSSRNYGDNVNKQKNNHVIQAQQKHDKIPDVPPPPVPTSQAYKKS